MTASRPSGVCALWDCVPRVCGGGGSCAGGGVPLGAVPVLSWCGEMSRLSGVNDHHHLARPMTGAIDVHRVWGGIEEVNSLLMPNDRTVQCSGLN